MSETQANQEQVRFWNEQGGPRWVKLQHQLDAQIDQLGLFAMQRAAVQPGEHVIDVGCGCGQASLELAERVGPEGTVLGVDISAPMLARARDRQSELNHKNLAFVEADAQTYRFEPDRFDLVFSRFGVMSWTNTSTAGATTRVAKAGFTVALVMCFIGEHEAVELYKPALPRRRFELRTGKA